MCGRYAATANPDELVLEFEVDEDRTGEPGRSVLVNPQDPPPGARPQHGADQAGARRARPGRRARTGDAAAAPPAAAADLGPGAVLVQGPRGAARMINARVETVADKPAFARALAVAALPGAGRRLVRVAGVADRASTPRASRASSRSSPPGPTAASVAMAGLYEFWRDPTRRRTPTTRCAWLTTFTVITGPAEPGLDRIHDRKPLVLEPEEWATWLDPADRRRRRARPARAAAARPLRGLPRVARPSAATATTARSCSSRCRPRSSSAWSTR